MSSSERNDPAEPGQTAGPEIPEPLRRDLLSLHRAGIEVPGEVDEAVLSAARSRLGSGARWRRSQRWAAGLAAAACLALAFLLWDVRETGDGERWDDSRESSVRFVKEDIDRSGRVDILDAFLLAYRIKEERADVSWDFNGDGEVNRGDVDLLAHAAVRVR